jgi:N-methylhydantoinase A
MDMEEVVVPIVAGLFSSLGLLFADTAVSRMSAVRVKLHDGGGEAIEATAGVLSAQAREELSQLGGQSGDPEIEIRVNLRYVGQSSTLMLPYRSGTEMSVLADSFHSEHRRAYGQAATEEAVEVTAVRVRASWPAPSLTFAEIARQEIERERSGAQPGPPITRTLYFGSDIGSVEAPIITRSSLDGAPALGPLVIEEAEATVLVPPGTTASLDATGSVILRR